MMGKDASSRVHTSVCPSQRLEPLSQICTVLMPQPSCSGIDLPCTGALLLIAGNLYARRPVVMVQIIGSKVIGFSQSIQVQFMDIGFKSRFSSVVEVLSSNFSPLNAHCQFFVTWEWVANRYRQNWSYNLSQVLFNKTTTKKVVTKKLEMTEDQQSSVAENNQFGIKP